MLEAIEFMEDRFKRDKNYNLIEFTNNTIILCCNYKLMDTLTDEIVKTVNGEAEYNNYWCDNEDVGKAKLDICFGLQRVRTAIYQKTNCRKTYGCLIFMVAKKLNQC